jgi:hypothetical protein
VTAMVVGSGALLGRFCIEGLHRNAATRIDYRESIPNLGRKRTTQASALGFKLILFFLRPSRRRGVADIEVRIKRSGPTLQLGGECFADADLSGINIADFAAAVMPQRPAVVICHQLKTGLRHAVFRPTFKMSHDHGWRGSCCSEHET